MALHRLAVDQRSALPNLVVRLLIIIIVAGREDVLQLVAAVPFVTTQMNIIGSCAHIGNGQRAVLDVVACAGPLVVSAPSPCATCIPPAEVNLVKLQVVGFLTFVSQVHTPILRHFYLVPVVNVAIVLAVQIAQMALHGLAVRQRCALTVLVVRLFIVNVGRSRKLVVQLTGTAAAVAHYLYVVSALADVRHFQRPPALRVVAHRSAIFDRASAPGSCSIPPAEVDVIHLQVAAERLGECHLSVLRHLNFKPSFALLVVEGGRSAAPTTNLRG